uniref:Thioredoxin H-type n=1 Tax=Aegilops tauschii TaxID=37682 RepID=M8BXN3_AEGTA
MGDFLVGGKSTGTGTGFCPDGCATIVDSGPSLLAGATVLMREILLVAVAHASLDDHAANWFTLDQSMYHWALNDYYDSTNKVYLLPERISTRLSHPGSAATNINVAMLEDGTEMSLPQMECSLEVRMMERYILLYRGKTDRPPLPFCAGFAYPNAIVPPPPRRVSTALLPHHLRLEEGGLLTESGLLQLCPQRDLHHRPQEGRRLHRPCRVIAPVYAEMSKNYPQLMFLPIDVDDLMKCRQTHKYVCSPVYFYLAIPCFKEIYANRSSTQCVRVKRESAETEVITDQLKDVVCQLKDANEAAKNLVVATTAAPSVRALRAPITNTSYGSEVTFYVPFGRCYRPRTVARGVGDTDEVEQSVLSCSFLGVWSRGFGRGSQAICGIFTGVLLVCGSGGMDKKEELEVQLYL